ncbi:MMPL family transporter [Nocardia sp. NPDC058176]|uniref:MMPL family transporter n=1 Tax=Nocardia sp. NPDC058176 TaxID=3346368 RepID=UPI0036DC8FA3
MFTRWGDLVYRFRFAVIAVVGAALLALGAYGTGLGDRLTQSGWFDPGSESVQGAELADASFGRDHMADVIVMYNAPEGGTIDDPEFQQKVVDNLTAVTAEHPDQIDKINGTYWRVGDAPAVPSAFGSKDKKHAFASIAIVGDDDTTIMANYRVVADVFYIPGVDVEVSGLQPLAVTLNDTIAHDTKRMEVLALPAVAILLFFIFGGIVAAALPLIIGGLTIIGATGLVMTLTNFTEVNSFVTGVVSMIGLGLAIDYGLFIVSRFREELAEGYDTKAAVRRSVVTAGRTVVFSATMIIASLGGVLLFPQGFLRSVAYGTIATVSLAALTAVTILPAMLAVLGPRVDMLGLKWFRKNKTAEQIENGFWGNLTRWVMKHPLKIAIPVTVGLLLLIIPVKNLAFGGINEKYLPPDNDTRAALEHFYEVFPQKKTDPIQLVFVSDNTQAIGQVWKEANQAPGLVGPFEVPVKSPGNAEVFRTSATLVDPTGNAEPTIDYLRSIAIPDGVTMYVTGQPALMADSIDTLLELMPWMIAIVLLSTFVLMFLTFGSLVLPIKAALMSALGLGSTLGILTWIFIDGNGAGILNFTPQPISAPVLMLIIAIIYGLSTDYEVFLLSRMVEARAQGASTTEAVRIGTAQTGRIITAAALILLVVTGAFAFSDMVMMQYIAYGMIAALFIDATVLRMLLVPAIMKLLGDDCWWAPKWMKRIQEKIGLGEPILDDERPQKGAVVDLVKTTPITDPPTMQMTAVPDSKLARTPRRPRTVAEIEAEAPTQRMDKISESPDPAEPARPRHPMSPDPTRPRASMLSSGEPTRVLPVVKPGSEPGEGKSADPAPDVDPPKNTTGEPTRILPVVKPGTTPPKPDDPDTAGTAPETHGDTGFHLGDTGSRPTRSPDGDTGSDSPGTAGPNLNGSNGFHAPGDGPRGDNGFRAPNDSSRSADTFGGSGSPSVGNANDFRAPGSTSPGGAGDNGFGTPGGTNPSAHGGDSLGTPGVGGLNRGLGESGTTDSRGDNGFRAPSDSSRATGADGASGLPSISNPTADRGIDTPRAPGPNSRGDNGFGAPGVISPNPSSGNTFGAPGIISADPSGDTDFGRPGDGGSGSDTGFGAPGVISSTLGDDSFRAPSAAPESAGRGSDTDFRSPGNALRSDGVDSPGNALRTDGVDSPGNALGRGGADSSSDAGSRGVGSRSAEASDAGLDLPRSSAPAAPRGSERVQPPAGYTPPGLGDSPVPRISTPRTSGDDTESGAPADDPFPRPSIVTPIRPGIVNTPPPRGVVPPQTPPSIVNTPPSMVTPPRPRTSEPPAGGTFSGFTAVPTPERAPSDSATNDGTDEESSAWEPESRPRGFVPPSDLSATPGAHRAESSDRTESRGSESHGTESRGAGSHWAEAHGVTNADRSSDAERPTTGDTPAARGIFGTPVPVEPQQPTSPWSDRSIGGVTGDFDTPGTDTGPRFSPVTPEPDNSVFRRPANDPARDEFTAEPNSAAPQQDSRPEIVRPQSAPPGFTAVPTGEPTASASPWQDESARPAADPDSVQADGYLGSAADQANSANRPSTADADHLGWSERADADSQTAGQPDAAEGWHERVSQAGTDVAGRSITPDQIGADAQESETAGQWRAPSGFTAVPTPAAPTEDTATTELSAAEVDDSVESGSTAGGSEEPQAESNRNEIENWMAQLRSSRRGNAADEGRHSGNEGRTVSVNELLRRREDETD